MEVRIDVLAFAPIRRTRPSPDGKQEDTATRLIADESGLLGVGRAGK
jgi:hypothetical protein